MDGEHDELTEPHRARDAHKALGLWPIRWALTLAFSSAAALLIAAWFLVSWFLGAKPKTHPEPLDTAAQLELLKLVLALVAGVGALVALVTAYRRQRVEEAAGERAERIQAHAEKIAVQSHEQAERVAREAAHDATERRLTDLYGQAVEQLGHDKAAVRLGGLYSLERLAQDQPQHRQTIINVVCAYLRMPFGDANKLRRDLTEDNADIDSLRHREASALLVHQDDELSSELQKVRQEIEVRRAAQNILRNHLRRYDASNLSMQTTYWKDISIDLSGAILLNFSLADCEVVNFECRRAIFLGTSWFDRANFQGEAKFHETVFQGLARFYGANFDNAYFYRSSFCAYAGFSEVTYRQCCAFAQVHFLDRVSFDRVVFCGRVDFRDALFVEQCNVEGARVATPSTENSLPPTWSLDPSDGLIGVRRNIEG